MRMMLSGCYLVNSEQELIKTVENLLAGKIRLRKNARRCAGNTSSEATMRWPAKI